MYYFIVFLLIVYTATYKVPKKPEETEPETVPAVAAAGAGSDAANNASAQKSDVELAALSIPTERKEALPEQKSESNIELAAPSIPEREVSQDVPERKKESNVELAAPSAPIEEEEASKESPLPEQKKESNIELAAPSVPEKTDVRQEISELKKESGIALAVPPVPVEKEAIQEAPPELKKDAVVEPAAPPVPVEKEEKREAPAILTTGQTVLLAPVKNATGPLAELKKESDIAPVPPATPVERIEDKSEAAPIVVDLPVGDRVATPAIVEKTETVERPKEALKIEKINFSNMGKVTRAEIVVNGELPNYKVFNLRTPDRVVIDIADIREIQTGKEIAADTPRIKRVRLGRYSDRVRVVFDCKGAQPYDVASERDRVIISFGKPGIEAKGRPEPGSGREAVVSEKAERMKDLGFGNVRFDAGRYDIKRRDKKTLDVLARWLLAHNEAMLIIEGHSDGREGGNDLTVGKRRANAVKEYLVAHGVSAARISTIGFAGDELPLCTRATEECRRKNRRVSFDIEGWHGGKN